MLVGHSLGAGTAALLGVMLRDSYRTARGPFSNILKIPAAKIICWGFACPPCVDRKLAISSSFVYNVVLQVLTFFIIWIHAFGVEVRRILICVCIC